MTTVSIAEGVIPSYDQIVNSALYRNWLASFQEGWQVPRVHFDAALYWNNDVQMAFVSCVTVDPDGKSFTSGGFLRGPTVDILPVLIGPDGQTYVALVKQSRPVVGRTVIGTPAGMIEGNEANDIAALRELDQEVVGEGKTHNNEHEAMEPIAWGEPRLMNPYATMSNDPFLTSPDGTNEEVFFYVVEARVTADQLKALDGRKTGVFAEHEFIGVALVPVNEALPYLARKGKPDLKSTLSLMLYERMPH